MNVRGASRRALLPPLELSGAREHNLQDLDLRLTHGQWIAVTGPSGSGKTSLVFDTLVRESQRRFLGALSTRARQVLGKLGRANADRLVGLPATVAIGARSATANPRSTVGTLSGLAPLLRVLFARAAQDPAGEPLHLSSFSFNHSLGACPACRGLGVEDRVEPELLIADPSKSLREGALRPTLPNGYTVYSQVTLEVMDQICRVHGFDVDTPWRDLSAEQAEVIFFGTDAIEVPFGKHSIESRMRWEGITARPREVGHYRGLIPVLRETLTRNRNPNVLRYVRSVPCSACAGSRLARAGREARLGARTLPELCALPLADLLDALDATATAPASREGKPEVWQALRPALAARVERATRLGLGHLSLERESTTLSGGEGQRLRLATQLSAGLSGLLVALDEPTLGLHPQSQAGMAAVLEDLRALGNTLLVVEHDPDMVRRADHHLSLGPGAGPAGGRLVRDGPLGEHPLGHPPTPRTPRPGGGSFALRGARLHGLQDADLEVRIGAFNVVLGPSGAGKSSLVFGTLQPALEGRPGGPFDELQGVPAGLSVRSVDASPIGRTPRSTPATYTGLFDRVRKRFAQEPAARELGFKAGHFSYNNKSGRCQVCEGLGVERVGLHLLADVERTCAACGGGRYAQAVLAVKLAGKTIAEVLALSVTDACAFFEDDLPVAALCRALDDLGLGYLRLGQSSTTLSRGEAQRVKLATLLGQVSAPNARSRSEQESVGLGGGSLLLLDEPDRGLHPDDVARLLRAIDALVESGHTVLAISHHRALWAAADLRTGVEAGATRVDPPISWEPLSLVAPPRAPAGLPPQIALTGVRTHSLQGVDVEFPRGALTAVVGVSGSGKSSLAFATLAAEAKRRFAETLPFEVRRHLRRLPRPDLDAATGLGPTLELRQRADARPGARSTVATLSGLGPLLRLLFSRAGSVAGDACRLSAAHFSANQGLGACAACEGLGQEKRCSPELLLTHPERSLAEGALSGTKVGAFLSEPDGQFMATLAAVLGPDALTQAWCELSQEQRELALYGSGELVHEVSWAFQRGKRSGEHRFKGTWDGLCPLAEREAGLRAKRKQAAAWAEPLIEVPCTACEGERLNPQARAVRLEGHTAGAHAWSFAALGALTVHGLGDALDSLRSAHAGGAAALRVLRPELEERCRDLCALGLGHLSLRRRSQTLSDGELQRVRLAGVLRSGLTGLTLVLDEPGAGLHARDVGTLLDRLGTLRDAGNTVIVVSHRPQVVRRAEHLVELGPGAGEKGGQVVAAGSRDDVLAGESATALALRSVSAAASAPAKPPPPRLRLRGARANTLKGLDLSLPASGFVAVTGVSGSGKSSLVFDVLAASASAGAPRACEALAGLEHYVQVRSSRAASSRAATPLDALGLLGALQAWFLPSAKEAGLSKSALSFRSAAGRCPTCKGSGREVVALEVLADLQLPCPACEGKRYRPEVLGLRRDGLGLADVLERPLASLELGARKLDAGAKTLTRVGLGHLAWGRRTQELSGGELARLSLAATLHAAKSPSLLFLDEPARGLHEQDVATLVEVLRETAARGDLIVAAAHRLSLIRAADHVVDLGPEGGLAGGRVVAQGAPHELIKSGEGATADALRAS